jgi:hypothetical protein
MEVEPTNSTEEPITVWGEEATDNASPPQLSESAVLLSALQLLKEEMGAMRSELAALKSQTTTPCSGPPAGPATSPEPAPDPLASLKGRVIDDDLIVTLRSLVMRLVGEALQEAKRQVHG